MKFQYALLLLLCATQLVGAEPAGKKGCASPEGLEAAKKDVEALKLTLKRKSPDQLVKEFSPAGQRRFGGYEYYYKYMANMAIRDELCVAWHSKQTVQTRHEFGKRLTVPATRSVAFARNCWPSCLNSEWKIHSAHRSPSRKQRHRESRMRFFINERCWKSSAARLQNHPKGWHAQDMPAIWQACRAECE